MGSKKLIWCCIIGIALGFIVPLVFRLELYTFLMVGMVGGLAIGYLLDTMDSRQKGQEGQLLLNEKAQKANQLMARARRGVENEYLRMDHDEEDLSHDEPEDEEFTETDEADRLTQVTEMDDEEQEQAEKLSAAEELLRSAREKMK